MLKYIPYVLMFAVATMIIYGWGLWRTMHQKQDLSNMLCSKGISKVKKALKKNKSLTKKELEPFVKDLTAKQPFNSERIGVTKVGKFIRATSIDELPQLVNVLKGDMALIGFRSPLTYHPWPWSEYTEEQKKMFNVRPGITGWAQVNGRKTVEWNKRIELNGWYAEHVSFWLDVKILFMTVFKVLTNADNENVGETVKQK